MSALIKSPADLLGYPGFRAGVGTTSGASTTNLYKRLEDILCGKLTGGWLRFRPKVSYPGQKL